ncbi:SAVMC3_10250 family protein [Streptomyces coeruleorubidus]|uniref:SAVMC3_10250 family protein n=1 Tax=Streptomyces coeruleorubidus TaxID=116188 RepID=A0ABZ0KGQ2_STRC4|nr:SAVMC3_10250 family protein [Streptomyces coeruleorubidus]WOT36946.1 SAVMC3_10250 family protein [Streptomyces coeruleorubidus]
MRELLYLSSAKLGEFLPEDSGGFSDRAWEAEASVLGAGVRLAVGEAPAAEEPLGQRLEGVLAHVRAKCGAHTNIPDSCASLQAYDWMEFTGFFRHGPRLRDWGLDDSGVYTFMSLEDPPCSLERGEGACSGIQIILCGSRKHVLTEFDASPTRMGSGSDWLHDLAAVLVEREARGDTSLPEDLHSTSRRDKEFAARSAYDMLVAEYEGPAYLHGHARVLCNFPPGVWQHRLIVATPLYVEAVPRPRRGAIEIADGQPAVPRLRPRLQRFIRRTTSR